uniref:HTH CENPB-type domain-containing protein n=1 Tax=Haplochromis burtoni TaxID=8153 RepID=A0A3Q2X2X7_HAPBU
IIAKLVRHVCADSTDKVQKHIRSIAVGLQGFYSTAVFHTGPHFRSTSFNEDAKRVVTFRNKTIVRMESALALWISGCREKNITLDTNIICSKAKKLYETFADSEDSFNASKGWFEKFKKHFGLKSVSLHGEAASADTTGAEAYVNNKFKAIIEEGRYEPEQVFNMDETCLFWKRMPSRTFIMQDEVKAPGFKAQKDCMTLVMCGNAAGSMIKPGLIYRSKNPRALKNKNKNALPCFIPEPNTTPLIQPMDQGIILAFKALYTHNTLQHLVVAMESDQDFSLKDYWRECNIAPCLKNTQRAIQEMKTETLNAYRFNDMTPDDINALIDTQSQPLTDEDLAEMTKLTSKDEGEEDEEDASVDIDEEDGLTFDRLATMVRMANELQLAAQDV